LDKYFEGKTSHSEEEELKIFFSKDILPEKYETLRPLFDFSSEICSQVVSKEIPQISSEVFKARRNLFGRKLYLSLSAAACLLIAVITTVSLYFMAPDYDDYSKSYAIVSNEYIGSPELAKDLTITALNNVDVAKKPRKEDVVKALLPGKK
ncbi:MAG: hypothetical protein Q4A76_06225, partial [Porphyromonadaceae bacterium]|nr:hypothetical protein [Porphyromonadaceae bacterium]